MLCFHQLWRVTWCDYYDVRVGWHQVCFYASIFARRNCSDTGNLRMYFYLCVFSKSQQVIDWSTRSTSSKPLKMAFKWFTPTVTLIFFSLARIFKENLLICRNFVFFLLFFFQFLRKCSNSLILSVIITYLYNTKTPILHVCMCVLGIHLKQYLIFNQSEFFLFFYQ